MYEYVVFDKGSLCNLEGFFEHIDFSSFGDFGKENSEFGFFEFEVFVSGFRDYYSGIF
jgi:hypothetical protein